ncbi:acetyl esterase [Rhodococcus koreensis]|uniref:Acetyl esterase n=1 Tax=Rhodococcus koreensis TaxID=99653 RepID=A0A1H4MFT6_9NOCA|nr:acetyl esterase [Rhodococcus koreensis]
MALDTATQKLLATIAALGEKPLHCMTLDEARAFPTRLARGKGTLPADRRQMSSVSDHMIVVPGGGVRVRMLVPRGVVRAVVVYYHGGGWVLGGIEQSELLGRFLADTTGCVVALVDYRLAPEHRFPTAINDAWAALLWVHEHIEQFAGSSVPLIVGGDSAGGTLAAVVTHRARNAGFPRIALQILVYPATDSDFDRDSYLKSENQLLVTRETLMWFWNNYDPTQSARSDTEAVPLHEPNLAELPPAIVVTAEHDPLRDEAIEYADRLRRAGVPVVSRHFEDQMHGFFTLFGALPASRIALEFVADEIAHFLTTTAKEVSR